MSKIRRCLNRYLPPLHHLLREFKKLTSHGKEAEVLMHGLLFARPSSHHLREVLLNGQAVLPVAAGIEV